MNMAVAVAVAVAVNVPMGDLVRPDGPRLAQDTFQPLGEHADDGDAHAKESDAGGASEQYEDDRGRDEE